MGFVIDNFRKVYGQLDQEIKNGLKRQNVYRRNSKLLEQVLSNLVSPVEYETEKGIRDSQKVTGLGQGTRGSIRDFGERRTLGRDMVEGPVDGKNNLGKNGRMVRQQQQRNLKEFGGIGVIDFDSELFEENEKLREEARKGKDKEKVRREGGV